jgi:hypothetical protein
MDSYKPHQDEEMAPPTSMHSHNAPALGLPPPPSMPLGYPQQQHYGIPLQHQGHPPMAMPADHLQSRMTYGVPQQGGMWYSHPYMMVGMPPYVFGGQPMIPNAPAPNCVPSQVPQLAPAASLPYTETRVPWGAPVKPMRSTEGERCTEPHTRHRRDPSIK